MKRNDQGFNTLSPGPSPAGGRGESSPSGTDASPSPVRGRGVGERANRNSLLDHARALCRQQTDAENRLWYHLRASRFRGLKFRRQKPIGPYIVDFVCLSRKLVIEADGGQHGDMADRERDAWFEARSFTVLRFWNNEILHQTGAVLERIREVVERLSDTESPRENALPDAGGREAGERVSNA